MPGRLSGLRVDLEWRTTVLTLMLLPLLIGLGFWQLERADEKSAIGAQWEQRRQLAPVPLQSVHTLSSQGLEYLKVELSGQFLEDEYFLLDNRIHQGRFGYEVLAILRLDGSEQAVLVNRGWIAGDSSRLRLPDVEPVTGQVHLTGHVYVAPGAPYLLADVPLETGWPKRIQAVEIEKLGMAVKNVAPAGLFPYPIRLDARQAASLTVDWKVVNVSPHKHTGYAVQWFAMAVALFILFVLRSSNLWQVLVTRGRNRDS